jgi:hypothetical protein
MRFDFDWDGTAGSCWSCILMSRSTRTARRFRSLQRAGRPGAKSDNTRRTIAMKDEYDFSAATRGKFYRPDAQLIQPVHLDPEVLAYLADRAKARGVSLSGLVNDLLKKDIALIEAGK